MGIQDDMKLVTDNLVSDEPINLKVRAEMLMVNEACKLYSEAIEKIVQAKALFKECGIIPCSGIHTDETLSDEDVGCNIQIYKGINKLANLTGASVYPRSINDPEDKAVKMKLGNIQFLQLTPDK